MDHLEAIPDSPYPALEIPCLSAEPYDHPDFLTYPQCAGLDIDRLLAGDFAQHEDPAAFLQTWLFFGILWEVFSPIGKGAKSHYIKPREGYPHGIITVATLDEQILELDTLINTTYQGGDKTTAQSIGYRIEKCLRTVSRLCRIATCEGDPRPGFTVWPLSPEIDLSIKALGQRLAWSFATGALNLVFSSTTGGLEFPCAWLPLGRMQATGWCTSEVAMVEETFSSSSAYYISQLETPPSGKQRDHSKCTRNLCVARKLNEETYRTAHTTDECDCQHHGPLIDDITSILESGGVPLLSITPTKQEPYIKVEVEKYTTNTRYIAFSHVWSDGLGNPSANTLPRCQLLRIQTILDELVSGIRSRDLVNRLAFRELWKKKFHGSSLSFWMDTMCIPVGEEHRELRSKAIRSMKAVYERAFFVLVLDADIQSFPSSGHTQPFMRIRLSAWMRRLWTLNEGVLANRLCVKFSDGILDIRVRLKAEKKETYGSELMSIKRSFGTPMRDADNFEWKFRLLRINVMSEPDPRLVMRTTNVSVSPEVKRCYAIMEAFSAALYRSTSKESDEMLCFANLIGWDTSLLKGLPFEDHMHALLSTESHLPQGMLFLAGPRMRQHGWRWAVNRFGNCGARRLSVKFDDMTPGPVTKDGFVVQYPALVLPMDYTRGQYQHSTVSAELGNGFIATFKITRHNEGLANAPEEPDSGSREYNHDQLYVLFWDMAQKMASRSPMPAAVISGPSDENLIKGEILYRFEHLAYLEILENTAGQLQETPDGLAQLVQQRKWTMG